MESKLNKDMYTQVSLNNLIKQQYRKLHFLTIVICLLFIVLLGQQKVIAQTLGLNTTGAIPDSSAMLDILSPNKGLLIPRVSLTSTTDTITIADPATSLLVYNTNASITGGSGLGYYYYNGSSWVNFLNSTSSSIATPLIIGGTSTTSSLTYKPTTGVGTTGADHIFKVGNNGATEAMRILNNGFVGIGIVNPLKPLHVEATTGTIAVKSTTGTNAAWNQFTNATGTSYIGNQGSVGNEIIATGGLAYSMALLSPSTANAMQFATNNTARMTILGDGNVGIGTTAPWTKLAIPFNNALSFGSVTYPLSISRTSAGELFTTITDGYVNDNARIIFYMKNGATNPLTLAGTGNVGMGTTAPVYQLHIEGNVSAGSGVRERIRNLSSSSSTYSVLEFGNDAYPVSGGFFLNSSTNTSAYGGANSVNLVNVQNFPLAFGTNNTIRMNITGAGNVGIGTTSPVSKLNITETGPTSDYNSVTVAFQANGAANGYITSAGKFTNTLASSSHSYATGIIGEAIKTLSYGYTGTGVEGRGIYRGNSLGGSLSSLDLFGTSGKVSIEGTGANTINSGKGLYSYVNVDAGNTLTNYWGAYIAAPIGSGTITNKYAFVTEANAGNVGIGTTTPLSKLHTVSTTEQLRLGYDASNYYSTTVGSTGGVTFNAVGAGSAFTFSDAVNLPSASVGVTQALNDSTTKLATTAFVDRAVAGVGSGWGLTGTSGTVDGTNFIGTTDNIPFNIKVNNQKAGRIDQTLKNSFLGYQAATSNTTGHDNIAIGHQALYLNTTGYENTANGVKALYSNTSGVSNTATGFQALYTNSTGLNNTANGWWSLLNNTTGSANTANGLATLYFNTTGDNNSASGYEALFWNSTGYKNTASGYFGLFSNTTGYQNTGHGYGTGYTNTTGYNNTFVGYNADISSAALNNATAIGANTSVNATNKVRIGDANVTVIEGQVAFTSVSDGRFKKNISETDVKGLPFIMRLRPVVYNLDTRQFEEFLTKNKPDSVRVKHFKNKDFAASTAIRHSGFIAQEVELAAQETNYDFNGIHKPEGPDDNYGLAYAEFVVPIVKAVQEQQKLIEAQQLQLEKKDSVLTSLQIQIDQLTKMIQLVQKPDK